MTGEFLLWMPWHPKQKNAVFMQDSCKNRTVPRMLSIQSPHFGEWG